jgi:uncharacterized protein YndB with AHSA1/START domain
LIYAATRPDVFTVERTIVIQAPPAKIFALLNDFHAWASWSPYEHLDPAMKKTFSGASLGQGAIYQWDGNGGVGAGRMQIVQSVAPAHVLIQLDMLAPFEGHNTAAFDLHPQDAATVVKWSMTGPQKFMGKLLGIFVNVDKVVGTQFEEGLTQLKKLAEK